MYWKTIMKPTKLSLISENSSGSMFSIILNGRFVGYISHNVTFGYWTAMNPMKEVICEDVNIRWSINNMIGSKFEGEYDYLPTSTYTKQLSMRFDDFSYIETMIESFLNIHQHENLAVLYNDRNLSHKAYRWAVYQSAVSLKFTCSTLYEYINDTHIDSALKRILGSKFS